MKNPLYKAGIKPGIHRIGQGVEKKIRIRDIRSPQHLVDEKKVQKLARFTKNMPGIPTVSHASHGKYVLKDGNHRVNAALSQGKRKITVKVQKFEANDELQPHQKRAIRRLLEPGRPGLILAHGLGSGKTRTAIEAHKALGGQADVVLPAALRSNYAKELEKWGGDPESTNVISQQNLSLRGRKALKSPLLIVDEGHRARNPKAKLSEALKAGPAQKRLILSGTPMFNQSADIATLVNQAAGRNVIREGKKFEKRYLNPGIIERWRGKRISHEGELKGILSKYVDYHKGDPSTLPEVEAKVIPVEMTDRQSKLYRAAISGVPKGLGSIQAKNIQRLSPYLTGARQVSNTARAIDPTSNDEPKLDRIVSDLKTHLQNPKGKALVYSNWLEHGVIPIHHKLEKEGILHGLFTGKETEKARNRAVSDYNADKLRALIVSSSGTEGLDLKGTRLVQVAEPHFNNAKLRQVVGRSARIGSHSGLPEEDRKVEVRQYIARPKRRFFGGHGKGVEDILSEAAREKDETDRQIAKLYGMSSKRKLIEFARPGEMAQKYLIGTPYDTEEGRALVDALTKHEEPRQIRSQKDLTKPGPSLVKERLSSDPARALQEKKEKWVPDWEGGMRKIKASDYRTTKAQGNPEFTRNYREARKKLGFPEASQSEIDTAQGNRAIETMRLKKAAADLAAAKEAGHPEHIIAGLKMVKQIQRKRAAQATLDLRKTKGAENVGGEIEAGRTRIAKALLTQRAILRQSLRKQGVPAPEILSRPVGKGQEGPVYSEKWQRIKARATPGNTSSYPDPRRKASEVLDRPENTMPGRLIQKAERHGAGQPLMGIPEGVSTKEVRTALSGARERLDVHVENEKLRRGALARRMEDALVRRATRSTAGGTPGMTGPKAEKHIPEVLGSPTLIRSGIGPGATIVPQPEKHYTVLSGYLGVTPETARKIHLRHKALAHPDLASVAREAAQEQDLFSGMPERLKPKFQRKEGPKSPWRTNLTSFPLLKKIAIGAGVLGAGALAYRVATRKKKEEEPQEMSSRTKTIEFVQYSPEKAREIFTRLKGWTAERLAKKVVAKPELFKPYQEAMERVKSAEHKAAAWEGHARVSQEGAEKFKAMAEQVKKDTTEDLAKKTNEYKEARQQFINEQNQKLEGIKRKGRRNLAIGIVGGVGLGGLAGYKLNPPDKPLQFDAIDASIEKLRHKLTTKKEPVSPLHDIITGGIEGSAGSLPFVTIEHRLLSGHWKNPFLNEAGVFSKGALAKRLAIGGGVGAVATGLIGAGVSSISPKKKKQEMVSKLKPIELASSSRAGVYKDRYIKQIKEQEVDRKESNYLRSAITGGTLGYLLRKSAKASLIGAGAGLLTQGAVNAAAGNTDYFGDENYWAKRAQKIPWQAAGLAGLGISGARLYKRLKMSSRIRPIQFDATAEDEKNYQALTWINKKLGEKKERQSRHWTNKWFGKKINVNRRGEDLLRYKRRAGQVARDVKGLVQGTPSLDERGRPRRTVWQSPWFQAGAVGLILGGGYKLAKGTAKALGDPNAGVIGQFGQAIRDKVPQKATRRYMAEKWPRTLERLDKLRGLPKQAGDEAASAVAQSGRLASLINKARVYAEGAPPVPGAPESPTESAKKALDKLRRNLGGSQTETYSSKLQPIHFISKNEYQDVLDDFRDQTGREYRHYQGDPVKQWEKLHPRVIQRNRRSKRFYETDAFDNAVIKPSLIATGLVGGMGIAAWRGRKTEKNIAQAVINRINPTPGELLHLVKHMESHVRPISFGLRTLKTGLVARWGKDLPNKLPFGTSPLKEGTYQLFDPATKAVATIQRTRAAKMGKTGPGKWWLGKHAEITNVNIPKENRDTISGGRALYSMFGGTKMRDGVTEHTGILGHFDRRGITATTVAGAYQSRTAVNRADETLKLVRGYQKRGFRTASLGDAPNEWNVRMVRSPGAKPIKPIKPERYSSYMQATGVRETRRSLGRLGEHISNITPSKAALGAAAIAGGAGAAATSDDDRVHYAGLAAGIPALGATAILGGRDLIKAKDYLSENSQNILKHAINVADNSRISAGRRILKSQLPKGVTRNIGQALLAGFTKV